MLWEGKGVWELFQFKTMTHSNPVLVTFLSPSQREPFEMGNSIGKTPGGAAVLGPIREQVEKAIESKPGRSRSMAFASAPIYRFLPCLGSYMERPCLKQEKKVKDIGTWKDLP